MTRKTDWGTLWLSIVLGVVLGVAVALIGVAAGLPPVAVAPITGAVVAILVPVVHRRRMKHDES